MKDRSHFVSDFRDCNKSDQVVVEQHYNPSLKAADKVSVKDVIFVIIFSCRSRRFRRRVEKSFHFHGLTYLCDD